MKGFEILARRDFRVRPFRLRQSQIPRRRNHAAQLGVELLDSAQINLDQALRSKFALLDPAREVCYRGESDIRIVGGQRTGIAFAGKELVTLWADTLAGQSGDVARPRCDIWLECALAWAGAPLVDRGQVHPPAF